MINKMSVKTQFIVSFILIIVLSLISTLITYYFCFVIYRNYLIGKIHPANYYEKKIPEIENYIKKMGVKILNPENKDNLEKIIPTDGISYQIIKIDGEKIYGTDTERRIENRDQFYKKLNTTFGHKEKYVKLIPLIDNNGTIVGGITLSYALKPFVARDRDNLLVVLLIGFIIFSPFLYIIIFTLLISRIFTNSVIKPLKILTDAANKIKEKNLDFQISYKSNNELGRLCEAFAEMKNELEKSLISQWKAEQERQEMVEALAHDLKTPLSIIQGYAESLLENKASDIKQKKYLNIIIDNAKKSSDLIQKMLYAAELESSNFSIDREPIDITKFITQKKEEYELLSKDKQLKFILNISDTLRNKKLCLINKNELERILDNIILNSIRYTPLYGTITINLDVHDNKVQFLICDSGKGFSKKDLSNLFKKFYRGDSSRSAKVGNAGLGLYIVKKLVEKHNGTVKAFNSEDGGACIEFHITIV